MAKKIMTIRLWILLIFLVMSVIAINPNPWAKGIEVNTVEQGSLSEENGISPGEVILSINDNPINTFEDYKAVISELEVEPFEVTVKTKDKTFTYNVTTELGFETNNLTVEYSDSSPLEYGMEITAINNKKITTQEDIPNITKGLFKKQKFKMTTNQGNYAFLLVGPPKITAKTSEKTNLRKGLDLAGGTRVLIQPESEDGKVTNKQISDLIKVMDNRLNVYGLKDLKIRSANDLEGNKFVLIEVADITRDEVKDLIAQQGKFEAKIGNETVFVGEEKDITFVCRGDGSCSGIRNCDPTTDGNWLCKYEFIIHISPDAAKNHAEITKDIKTTMTEQGEYLETPIDFYLDGKLVNSLQIHSNLKGKEATAISISGTGISQSQTSAANEALKSMDKLQTVLITGSLPLKINIVKMDTISPLFGKSFIKNSLLVGFLAIVAVSLVVFIRYKNFKIILPMVLTMVSELIIILGFASLIKWNLDLAAIAGIIAAIGTGVDDQIVITDEVLRGSEKFISWKEKIKRSFFIIMVAYFTTVAAMLPLWNAGAGLVKGFALIIIVGVTIGVFITRPAYASMIEKLLNR